MSDADRRGMPDDGEAGAFFRPSERAHLHPCTQVELLDRVSAIVLSRPGLFFGLGALSALPGFVMLLVLAVVPSAAGADAAEPGMAEALIMLMAWLLEEWPVAAIVACGFQAFLLPQRELRLWVAMQTVLGRMAAFAGTRMFAWAVVLGLMLFVVAAGSGAGGALSNLLALPALVVALVMLVLWSLAGPVILFERRSFVRALARSSELMRGRFAGGRLTDSPFSRLLLVLALPAAVFALEQVLVQAMGFRLPGGSYPNMNPSPRFALASGIVLFVGQTLRAPFLYVGIAMIYAECRMRREAFDLRVRMMDGPEAATNPDLVG